MDGDALPVTPKGYDHGQSRTLGGEDDPRLELRIQYDQCELHASDQESGWEREAMKAVQVAEEASRFQLVT